MSDSSGKTTRKTSARVISDAKAASDARSSKAAGTGHAASSCSDVNASLFTPSALVADAASPRPWINSVSNRDGGSRPAFRSADTGPLGFLGFDSINSCAWLQQFGLPADGSADFVDLDADGHNNWQVWICGTCPTNNCSVLRLLSARCDGTDVIVTWQSVARKDYFLECSTNLSGSPCFTCVATNLVGQPDITTYVHTNAASSGTMFYCVGVGN